MNLKHEITKLMEQLASERPTPMGADVFWPEDPAPVACSHGDITGKCRLCYYESSNAFDAALDDMHESRGHD